MEDGGVVGQEIVIDYQGDEYNGVIDEVTEDGDYVVITDNGRRVLAQKDMDVISFGALKKKAVNFEKPKRFGFFNKGGKMKEGGNLTHNFEKIAWDKMNSNERFHTLDYQFPRGYSIDERKRTPRFRFKNWQSTRWIQLSALSIFIAFL
jgi:hypothetical protein